MSEYVYLKVPEEFKNQMDYFCFGITTTGCVGNGNCDGCKWHLTTYQTPNPLEGIKENV